MQFSPVVVTQGRLHAGGVGGEEGALRFGEQGERLAGERAQAVDAHGFVGFEGFRAEEFGEFAGGAAAGAAGVADMAAVLLIGQLLAFEHSNELASLTD